jgi:aspartyl-tRNA(Asn)/glutamyl-tRNA(Gln) amidotransferase subunit A
MPEITDDILFLPAVQQREALHQGRFTSAELTDAYLARIQKLNDELLAYVQVDADGAREQARIADARIAAGERTPLLGLCVAIKDLIDVKGLRTTYGSRAFADNIASEDAPIVGRLRESGAVILGKANTTEFALFSPNMISGASLNPWNFSRTAGGSSNGSGTSTSAGLCSFAIGTDTAGSIRTPASFVGVFGLKPTHGRVPAAGIGELSTFMDTVGPFGRSAADIAATLQVVAGFEPSDMTSAEQSVPDYEGAVGKGVAGLVIGAPAHHMADSIDPDIDAAWRKTLEGLVSAGAILKPITLPKTDDAMTIWRGLVIGDALLWHEDSLKERGDLYSESTRMILSSSEGAPAIDVARARKDRWALRRDFLAAIEGVDAIVLPAAPVIAPLNSEIENNLLTSGDRKVGGQVMLDYALPFNVTGLPALVLPVAVSTNDMPVAVMVSAAPFREDLIVQVAAAIEKVMPFDTRPERYR